MSDIDSMIEEILPDSQWHRFTKVLLEDVGLTISDIRDTLHYKGRALGIPVQVDIITLPREYDVRCRLDLEATI